MQDEAQIASQNSEKMELKVVLGDRYPDRAKLKMAGVDVPQGFCGTIHLNELKPGAELEIELSIVNSLDDEISFTNVVMSCACTSFEIEGKKLPTTKITKAKLKTKLLGNSPELFQRIQFLSSTENQTQEVGYIDLVFSVKGWIGFEKNSVSFEVKEGSGKGEVVFPFRATPPTKRESLRISATKSLGDVNFSIGELKENEGIVVGVVPMASVPPQGLVGQVTLSNTETGSESTVHLSIIPKKTIDISPVILRFRKSGKDSQVANIIVQVNKDAGTQPKFFVEGKKVEIELDVNNLGNEVYRLKLISKAGVKFDSKLKIVVELGTEKFEEELEVID